jgi:DivIVA domain-containing protein
VLEHTDSDSGAKPAASEEPPEAEASLGNLRAHVPAELRNVSFPISVRGYDRRAVEAYVRRVNRIIAELEVSRSPQAAVSHAVERVAEQTKAVLGEAKESAEKIIATARGEGDQIMAEAKAKAADLVVSASDDADRARAEGEQMVARAQAEAQEIIARGNAATEEIVVRANAEGEEIIARANADAAERMRECEKEVAAVQEQAEVRLRELHADTAEAWKEREGLADAIEQLAARLHEAASTAAGRFADEPIDAPAEPSDASAVETLVVAPSSGPKSSSKRRNT